MKENYKEYKLVVQFYFTMPKYIYNELESGTLAFSRNTIRKPIEITAIVINHMILLNPSDSVPVLGIKFSILPCLNF